MASVNRPSLAGGDWNGDGLGDLVGGGNTGTLRLIASAVLASDGTGLEFPTSSTRSLPALGDMDGDADTDLIVLLDDGTARFYANNGPPDALRCSRDRQFPGRGRARRDQHRHR